VNKAKNIKNEEVAILNTNNKVCKPSYKRHAKESMENMTQVQKKCMKEEKEGMEDICHLTP